MQMSNDSLQRLNAWPAIEQAVQQLIASRRSENTRIAYTADWRKWSEFVVGNNVDLLVPGLAATTAFRDLLLRTHGPATVNRVLGTLSFIYAALRDAGLLRMNPFTKAWLPRPEVSELHKTPVIEDHTATRILQTTNLDQSPEGKRDLAIIAILYGTGMRRASVASLKRSNLKRDEFGLAAVITVKGGKEQKVRIGSPIEGALDAWLAVAPKSPYLFPKANDKQDHISLGTINNLLKRRALAAGIDEPVAPHRFRAAFITAAYDAQVYERNIQAAVHHANASTTRGYDRGARGEDVFDAVAKFREQKLVEAPPVVDTRPPQTSRTHAKKRTANNAPMTFAEAQAVASTLSCSRCGASPDEDCVGTADGVRFHRDRIVAATKIILAENYGPKPRALSNALNAARRRGLPAMLTVRQWRQTVEHFYDCCAYCGQAWSEIDHATPASRGGPTTFDNCLPACGACNLSKGDLTLEEFVARVPHASVALQWLRQCGRKE